MQTTNFKIDENDRKLSERLENAMGKGEIAFPTAVSKDLYRRYVKTGSCMGKGLKKTVPLKIPGFADKIV